MQMPFDADLLSPGPIREFRLDLTTRCNLRCVYCAVSQPGYVGSDMAKEVLKRALPSIRQIAVHNKLETVSVNGHGETTFAESWTDVCRELIDAGLPVGLTTNLARGYSDEELRVLSGIHTIAVSIDTCDRDLLRRMRRKVDVRQIVMNINSIRSAQLANPPHFHFLSGLYDKNSLHLEAFARFAVALRIETMCFWNMTKYDYEAAQIPEQDRALPLDELDDHELRVRLERIAAGFQILKEHGVGINVHGDFISRLAEKVGVDV